MVIPHLSNNSLSFTYTFTNGKLHWEAYEVLTSEEKRRIYDQYGEEGLKSGSAPQRQDGFFNSFFNFGQQRGGKFTHPSIHLSIHLCRETTDLLTNMDIIMQAIK